MLNSKFTVFDFITVFDVSYIYEPPAFLTSSQASTYLVFDLNYNALFVDIRTWTWNSKAKCCHIYKFLICVDCSLSVSIKYLLNGGCISVVEHRPTLIAFECWDLSGLDYSLYKYRSCWGFINKSAWFVRFSCVEAKNYWSFTVATVFICTVARLGSSRALIIICAN